jgi:hypothetical protein
LTLDRPKPGVLKLLVAPDNSQLVDAIAKDITAPPRRRSKVEQRTVGVEDARFHTIQRNVGHIAYLSPSRRRR